MVLTYEVSGDDRILTIEGEWESFAERNGAPALLQDRVVGQAIWSYIRDVETRHLLRTIFDRCRATGREVVLPLRCDSPDRRRWAELRVSPRPDGAVRVSTELLHEEERPTVRLLERVRLARGEPLRICAWCKRLPLQTGHWVDVEDAVQRLGLLEMAVLPPLAHGICPACSNMIEDALAGVTRLPVCA